MKKKETPLLLILAVIATFFLIAILNSGTEKLVATKYDEKGNINTMQSLIFANSIKITQSIYQGGEFIDFPIIMQAAEPVDEEDDKIDFLVYITNPFDSSATLTNLEVQKNGEQVLEEDLFKPMYAKEERQYTTPKLLLEGLPAQKNNIKLLFTFDSGTEQAQVTYEYNYLALINCDDDGDCEGSASKCDIGNNAGFSKDADIHYCVLPCVTHEQCAVGQLCKTGSCGY